MLQGIGSDSSYNPASGGYGGAGAGAGGGVSSPGGLNADEIGGQIGQIGQKSMRFLSESFATLQTGVKASKSCRYLRGGMEVQGLNALIPILVECLTTVGCPGTIYHLPLTSPDSYCYYSRVAGRRVRRVHSRRAYFVPLFLLMWCALIVICNDAW